MRKIILFILAFGFSLFGYSQQNMTQDSLLSDTKILLRKENSGFLMIHTSGFGAGFRMGKHLTGYKKRMLEFELTGFKHPKEIKSINPYFENSKSYIYGKMNSFFLVHAGWGRQKIINSKPYWGGIELRYFYSGGISMGLLKPVYLYILNETNDPKLYNITIEKYDPNKHFSENIYGRAPFQYGFGKIKPMPGIYAKVGLNFEYGAYDESIKAIEAGVFIDLYAKPVPIMAYNTNQNLFLSLYLAFHFGSRSN